MKTQNPSLTVSINAASALKALRFVGFDGNTCAANAKALGVAEYDTDADDMAPVNVSGIIIVEAGGAITQGAAVTAGTDGKAVAATALSATVPTGSTAVTSSSATPAMTVAGSVTPQAINGYALDAATAAGDMIRILC